MIVDRLIFMLVLIVYPEVLKEVRMLFVYVLVLILKGCGKLIN